MLLEIARIKATPEAQPRVSLHYPTVEEYAEALRGRAEFPPVVVFHDGKDYWLADGFHRMEAYKKEDRTKIPVEVRQGTLRDAVLFSVGANARHGLPRTNEDKRRAIDILLKDPEWGSKSDNWIADTVKVSHNTVLSRRNHLVATCQIDKLEQREGKDGKVRKLPERRPKSEPQSEPPPSVEGGVASDIDAEPESAGRPVVGPPEPPRAPVATAPTDLFRGCGSAMRLQAVESWAEQGEMIFKALGESGRDHMLNEWAKRVKRLEGYAA